MICDPIKSHLGNEYFSPEFGSSNFFTSTEIFVVDKILKDHITNQHLLKAIYPTILLVLKQ
jgi:hypothetical protein